MCEQPTQSTMQPNREIFTPPINPGDIPGPSREIHAAMGRDAIYRMLADFYRELEASAIRGMFPPDMLESSRRSAAFFVQLLGGPPEYNDQFGSPRLRARHLPFRITEASRKVWLACFERVLEHAPEQYGFPAEHLGGFRQFLANFSQWMVNTAGD
jgi:hemoglobin